MILIFLACVLDREEEYGVGDYDYNKRDDGPGSERSEDSKEEE
jgi:hypothetical protein